ncbi:methyltransferase domain protein [Corynebacterium sp. CMW7794]|nr:MULTISPECIES: class I SAM-dependent methyltransferase [Corynebacterium]KXI19698.1 methyltransferase domain protein [Corynebacterium sp. CMW7794]MBF9010560.1 class I SAM-dependent methyltransferase [Corynebacterium phoceense]MCQ9340584.1 class I SAM-dependent methyltransferase [Corynebacterium phoceense]MCQ9346449.1 class I SAM-dependent methyltransferase [Corynebacterium phoceense]
MTQHHHHHEHKGPGYQPTAEEMEARYLESEQLWSGNPNSTLVDYAGTLKPGTALDIGCGEGADLAWLAAHGWDAEGIDFAPTAVARTRAHGLTARVADFAELGGTTYDLVSVHYGGIPATAEAVSLLESLVAPGGTLLFVHHEMESDEVAMPEWLAEQLTQLEVVELSRRERHVTHGAGAMHHSDVILVARRHS